MPSSPDECTATPSLKRFANPAGFYTLANASPERGIQEDHIDRGVEYVRGELLEVDHDVLVASGTRTICRVRRIPFRP